MEKIGFRLGKLVRKLLPGILFSLAMLVFFVACAPAIAQQYIADLSRREITDTNNRHQIIELSWHDESVGQTVTLECDEWGANSYSGGNNCNWELFNRIYHPEYFQNP